MQANRISIIGISGSGKSVFSRELAKKTGLPLFHMDQLFWKGYWQEVPESEYLVEHAKLVSKDSWIIEGYIDGKMADRLNRSDTVIFLDYPGWCALGGSLKDGYNTENQIGQSLKKEQTRDWN